MLDCVMLGFIDIMFFFIAAMIENPEVTYLLYRNPRSANAGNFMTLSSFLSFTKDKKLSGVLIEIEVSNELNQSQPIVLSNC